MDKRFFVQNLLRWHEEDNDRQLAWKNEKDPYKIWLSEVILQQTRTAQGTAYYKRFIEVFPNINALAHGDEQQIFKLWEGLGYYNRCRNLIATAKIVAETYHGVFPHKYEDIIGLKGIGPYTAAAIASFAFQLPFAVVDGNVMRLLARYFAIALPIDRTEGRKKLDLLASELIDRDDPAAYNQAIMDFGATVCKPGIPDCGACPLRRQCQAYHAGIVNLLPVKSNKTKVRKRTLNFLFIAHGDHIYIRKRMQNDIWKGLYELPHIESVKPLKERGVTAQPALKELFETGVLRITSVSPPAQQRLTHQLITGQFIHITAAGRPDNIMDAIAVNRKHLNDYPFPKIVAEYLLKETNKQSW